MYENATMKPIILYSENIQIKCFKMAVIITGKVPKSERLLLTLCVQGNPPGEKRMVESRIKNLFSA
jgi:hypothetical protein